MIVGKPGEEISDMKRIDMQHNTANRDRYITMHNCLTNRITYNLQYISNVKFLYIELIYRTVLTKY